MAGPYLNMSPLFDWLERCEELLPEDGKELLQSDRADPKGIKLQHGLAIAVHGRRYAEQVQATRDMPLNPLSGHTQRMLSLSGYGAGDWLNAVPFNKRLPNHLLRCDTGKGRTNTRNELRDECLRMANDADFMTHGETTAFFPVTRKKADIAIRDNSSGAVWIGDVTITDPISTRDPNTVKGRGWAAHEAAEKNISDYEGSTASWVGFFPLAVDTYGCPCSEAPHFLNLLADTAALMLLMRPPHLILPGYKAAAPVPPEVGVHVAEQDSLAAAVREREREGEAERERIEQQREEMGRELEEWEEGEAKRQKEEEEEMAISTLQAVLQQQLRQWMGSIQPIQLLLVPVVAVQFNSSTPLLLLCFASTHLFLSIHPSLPPGHIHPASSAAAATGGSGSSRGRG
ncbi:unnamed protein product [Closterium sp. NIES-54]